MKKLLTILLLCLSTQALAMTVAGVKLEDKIRVNKSDLVLNGAGLRTKILFKVYIGALYLTAKKSTAEAVLADTGTKRIELYMMRHVGAGDFMEAFNKAVNANLPPDEYVRVSARLLHFSRVFREVGDVDKGDVILIDYLPDAGLVLTVKGKELVRSEGADFYRAMLKIWMGNKPVQDSLKKEMLGG